MLKRILSTHVLLCLTLLVVLTAGPLFAQELPAQGICLYREPAPPLAALNDGSGTVMFYWTVDYATNFNQDYVLEIVPPAPDNPFVIGSFPGEASPIINTAVWEVPAGAPAGCYYGRLTFYSDWCLGSPNKYESRAVVGFIVSPAARVQLCKFWDWNGDGVWNDDEPPLEGWQFTVQRAGQNQAIELVTDCNGCTPEITVPVDATGATTYIVTEVEQDGWVKTAPDGDTNPIELSLTPGETRVVEFGNWQPVTISGYKALDQAPWPWTDPHWVGDDGQENTADWEPNADWPFQPDQQFLPGVRVDLYGSNGLVLLGSTETDENGYFKFENVQWEPYFVLAEGGLQAAPPGFPYLGTPVLCDEHNLTQWPGEFVGTVSVSAGGDDFSYPDVIEMNTDAPTEKYQEYGNNVFFNRHPSRVWGVMCTDAIALGLTEITVLKDELPWPSGVSECCTDCGLYEVAPLAEEPEGLRPGTYTLTPPALSQGKEWIAVEYYFVNGELKKKNTLIGSNGSYTVTVPSGADIRVDFCIQEQSTNRVCYLPVTFTQEAWKAFCAPDNTIVSGGMIYNRFQQAFAHFNYYGKTLVDQIVVGKTKTITFEGTTSGLSRLCQFLPQTGRSGKLDRSYLNPWSTTSAGALAGETVALQLNIAYNDRRVMPRSAGYDLETFRLKEGLFKGKAVGEVLDIANAVLGGDQPARYGLPKDPADPLDTGYNALVAILHAINANYEFVDFATYNDRGYLAPNKKLGPTEPVHDPKVPYQL